MLKTINGQCFTLPKKLIKNSIYPSMNFIAWDGISPFAQREQWTTGVILYPIKPGWHIVMKGI